MTTFTALTTLPGKAQAEALGAAMERLDPEPMGIGVFEIEDGSGRWEVGGYFTDDPDEGSLSLLAAAFDAAPFAVSKVPETDWVAHVRRELSPVVAGRFFVHGGHDAGQVPDGAVGLKIEAAMAFGTGHHGTTQGCLEAFDQVLGDGVVPSNVLDLGCGTAVLAMAAARTTQAQVMASDIDPIAIDVAVANLAANDMAGQVDCVVAEGLDDPSLRARAPFDLVFANILKGPLMALAPGIHGAMSPGGILILSGLLNEQADEVAEVYCALGYNLRHQRVIGDWSTLTLCQNSD